MASVTLLQAVWLAPLVHPLRLLHARVPVTPATMLAGLE